MSVTCLSYVYHVSVILSYLLYMSLICLINACPIYLSHVYSNLSLVRQFYSLLMLNFSGPRGIQGAVGRAGAQGRPGAQGDTGPDGGPGPQGLDGPTGPDGPRGRFTLQARRSQLNQSKHKDVRVRCVRT